MSTQVTNYQCPACTGPLHFETSTGRLECAYCASVFTTEEVEALFAEKNERAVEAERVAEEKAAEAAQREAEAAQQAAEEGWDLSSFEDWGSNPEGMRAYNCPSCGADLICDESTAATACPYCDNPTIIPSQLHGVLKPDYVIPFKLTKEDAIAALKEHYKGRPFLPKVFKDENHLDEIKGVYVPFWLFDGEAYGSASYEGLRSFTFRRGDFMVTETSHFNVHREGSVAFSRIPVDASKKMDNDYMDSLEPYDYGEIQPFSTAYLPGFFADKYDDTVEECSERADTRARTTLVESLRSTVGGYEAVFERGDFVNLKRGEVKYALLPVWLLNTTWNGQRYVFTMNGQTGKFVGHLPTDKGLRRSMWLKVYGVAFVACLGLAVGLGLLDLFAMLGG